METSVSSDLSKTALYHNDSRLLYIVYDAFLPYLYYGECNFKNELKYGNTTVNLVPYMKANKFFLLCYDIVTLWRITVISLLSIGVPCNILAFLTILKFPRTVGTFYLAFLSISDLTALLMKLANVLILTYRVHDIVSCKLIITFSNFTATYANWILVLICFERLITITFPLQKNYYFTKKRARLSVIVLAVIIFLFESVHLWIVTAGKYTCSTSEPEFFNQWSHVSTALYSYLPSVCLFLMVMLIWRALRNVQKNRQLTFGQENQSAALAQTQQRLEEQAKMERSITVMFLFAAIIFLLLTVPLCVAIAVYSSGLLEETVANDVNKQLAFTIANGLVWLSHAINFFIYFVSTKRFRTQLFKLCKCSFAEKCPSTQDRSTNTVEEQL